MSASALVARLVHRLAHATGLSVRRARGRGSMRVVMVHDVGVDGLSQEAFDAQVAFLARHFDVLPLAEVASRARGERPINGREVAITFDDGLRSHATVAAPTLRRLGLPATFFLCAGLLGTGRWLWVHEARARLARLDEAERRRLAAGHALDSTPPHGAAELAEALKRLPPARRTAVEEEIRSLTPGFEATAKERTAHDLMGWEEATALADGERTIGSHTLTHPILPGLDEAALRGEVVESRALLERRLGGRVDCFCYPNGEGDARVHALVAAHYAAAVTVRPGIVRRGDDPHALARVSIAAHPATLAWRLHRP